MLVGAGPGDPGLITRAGLEHLRAADVVVYDALANPALLAEAHPNAELIDVGKRAGRHRLTQDQINDLLAEKARARGRVVRLKGGDPYLFGRGAEEVIALARAGVACQVIPGVTSGIAAPAAAGIPVTHRAHASTVTFVTGHEDPAKTATRIDHAALARLIRASGTACFYMAMGRWDAIAKALTDAGLSGDTPAAAVQWGTLPRQRSARATLATLAETVARAGLGPPAIVVVGDVAGIDDPALQWFERRPLHGRTILVTRTRTQASELSRLLGELGAAAIEAPTIELAPPADASPLDDAVRALRRGRYDWLVLTSANAVDALAERMDAAGVDARALAAVEVAVVGEATGQALRHRLAVRADVAPATQTGAALAEALIQRDAVAGRRLLLPRAGLAGRDLPELLTRAGGQVEEVVAYETRRPASLPAEAAAALQAHEVDWVTFTSSSTARHFVELLGARRDELLRGVRTASIGPSTSATMRELGLAVDVQPPQAQVRALVEAIVQAEAARDP